MIRQSRRSLLRRLAAPHRLALSLGLAFAFTVVGCAEDLGLEDKVFACADDFDCTGGFRCDPFLKVCVDPDFVEPGGGNPFDAADDDTNTSDADTSEPLDTDTAEDDADATVPDPDTDVAPGDTPDGEGEDVPSDVPDSEDVPDPVDTVDATDTRDTTDTPDGDEDTDTGEPDTIELGPCPDEMIRVEPTPATPYCLDLWEASRADATAENAGVDSASPPVSAPGVQPWVFIARSDAADACEAAGKRLCTQEELRFGCGGELASTYPYSNVYQPTTCNGYQSGENAPAPTGSFTGCESAVGALDLSGNVSEWTSSTDSNGGFCIFGGDFQTGSIGDDNLVQEACVPSAVDEDVECWTVPQAATSFASLGFRCCRDAAPR